MQRPYYSNRVMSFCTQPPDTILGEIARNNQFSLEQKQRNTWIHEIQILQSALADYPSSAIAFEYTIPRIGSRIDNIFLHNGVVYLIEFKVGETTYPKYAIDQVTDYALDLKYFHEKSHQRKIVPILVCTKAPASECTLVVDDDGVYHPICCNQETLKYTLHKLTSTITDTHISIDEWQNSQYMPTPTIMVYAK